jgi:hypothetical protein
MRVFVFELIEALVRFDRALEWSHRRLPGAAHTRETEARGVEGEDARTFFLLLETSVSLARAESFHSRARLCMQRADDLVILVSPVHVPSLLLFGKRLHLPQIGSGKEGERMRSMCAIQYDRTKDY